jgi:hypothetical protein
MINRANPETMAADKNSNGLIGEKKIGRVAINPNMAPVPIWTRAAQPIAIFPNVLINFPFSAKMAPR